MKLSAPTQGIFWLSVMLAVLGLLGKLMSLSFISTYAFWIVLIAYAVLALGCLLTKL